MRKKAVAALAMLLATVLLAGCWNYRSLNQMSIVAGMAIDRDGETGGYWITFEIVDMTGNVKEEGIKPMILEARGETLFEAARDAKRRISDKLYFGQMETVVISEELARSGDIRDMLDFFMRDAEVRETITIIVSREPCACDLLTIKGIGHPLVSFEIEKIITEDNKVTSSTPFMQLYRIHEVLHSQGQELVLPAFHNADNRGEPATEAEGAAVFKGQRLVGFLTPEQSKYYLFVMNEVKGGVLTCPSTGGARTNTTLEISTSSTRRSFVYRDGQLTMQLMIETNTYLNETDVPFDSLDEASIGEIERQASAKLAGDVADTIALVQSQFNSDIFGFGSMVYKQKPKLWNSLKEQWDTLFSQLEVRIECKVNIVNTASMREN